MFNAQSTQPSCNPFHQPSATQTHTPNPMSIQSRQHTHTEKYSLLPAQSPLKRGGIIYAAHKQASKPALASNTNCFQTESARSSRTNKKPLRLIPNATTTTIAIVLRLLRLFFRTARGARGASYAMRARALTRRKTDL